jgi:DNA-directed RNA polymerase specialized sigma24 family protein
MATEMTPMQFEVVADLLRSREPVRTAVRMVMVEGATTKAAAETTGLVPQSVTNALRRYRNAHSRLLNAYNAT